MHRLKRWYKIRLKYHCVLSGEAVKAFGGSDPAQVNAIKNDVYFYTIYTTFIQG